MLLTIVMSAWDFFSTLDTLLLFTRQVSLLFKMVPPEGIEPPRSGLQPDALPTELKWDVVPIGRLELPTSKEAQSLKLLRIPIPPYGHMELIRGIEPLSDGYKPTALPIELYQHNGPINSPESSRSGQHGLHGLLTFFPSFESIHLDLLQA